jgi:hypothetical protein
MITQPDKWEEIYSYLKEKSQYYGGLRLLQNIKKKFNCTTADIIMAQYPHQVKRISGVWSHTSIFDYGFTHEDLRRSRIKDREKEEKDKK